MLEQHHKIFQLIVATVQPLKSLLQGGLGAVSLDKLAVFFPGNKFGKACFVFTFVQCTVSLSAGCFFECVTGNTPVTQTKKKEEEG